MPTGDYRKLNPFFVQSARAHLSYISSLLGTGMVSTINRTMHPELPPCAVVAHPASPLAVAYTYSSATFDKLDHHAPGELVPATYDTKFLHYHHGLVRDITGLVGLEEHSDAAALDAERLCAYATNFLKLDAQLFSPHAAPVVNVSVYQVCVEGIYRDLFPHSADQDGMQ